MNRGPARRDSNRKPYNKVLKAFVWVFLAIFVLTSVGVALVVR